MLLEFVDYSGEKIAIPYHSIYYVKRNPIASHEIKCYIIYNDGSKETGKLYLKETYEEIVNYIDIGAWETSTMKR